MDITEEPSEELLAVNPVGGVPVLLLEDGQALTEVSMILQYLGNKYPLKGFVPEFGTIEYYRLQEWLSFTSSEIHKGFWPFRLIGQIANHTEASAELKNAIIKNIEFKFDVIAKN